MSIENLTDVLTPLIISNVYQRQELLEEINILKRAERILEQLETKLEIISITSKKINSILESRHLN